MPESSADAMPNPAGTGADSDAAAEPSCPAELDLSAADCAQVQALRLPDALPPSSGNRYADDETVARLGFLVFYDPRFSATPEVRCATCHLPERSFSDGKPVSEVIAGDPITRNSLSILNAAWAGPFFFWDGRADSLWSQPLFAFENPDEMASTRLAIAHALYDNSIYKNRYEKLFGALPDLADGVRFPATGKPGDATFDGMTAADQTAIDRVVANLGKALEAYMRKVATGKSALDRYLAGEASALEPGAVKGLATFAARGCMDCHSGPTLSDGKFHRLGEGNANDRGRADAIAVLRANPFNSLGAFYDADTAPAPALPEAPTADDEGAFRTPTLRNLSLTAPYGHAGAFPTIAAVLSSSHGARLSEQEVSDLTMFVLALNGAYPQRPWSDWPAR